MCSYLLFIYTNEEMLAGNADAVAGNPDADPDAS